MQLTHAQGGAAATILETVAKTIAKAPDPDALLPRSTLPPHDWTLGAVLPADPVLFLRASLSGVPFVPFFTCRQLFVFKQSRGSLQNVALPSPEPGGSVSRDI